MMVNGNLPDGWEWSTLNDVADINYRDPQLRNLPDDLPVNFVPMAAVDAQLGTIAAPEVRPLKEVRKGFTPFSDGDVIMAKITPSMENGKAAIARNLLNGRAFGSTEFHVFKPKESVLAEFLFYFIRQESFRKDAKAHFAGTAGQLRVPASFLFDYPFPLAPLPEQERIVSRIEELFSDLEAGVRALERVRAGLRRYKASVLKAAVSGKLVNGKLGIGDDDLPEGWQLLKLSEIAEVRLGRQRSPARAQGPNMRQYMRAANVTWHGIDLSDVKEMDFSPKEQETYRLKYGDILLSEASGSISEVGKPAIWKNQLPESYIQNTLIRVRPYKDSSEYLYYHFLYDAIAERFRKIAKGVGIHHLGAENLSNWEISLPPWTNSGGSWQRSSGGCWRLGKSSPRWRWVWRGRHG